MKKLRGYTLVELMIIIFIISLLFSIATPRFQLLAKRATQAATKNNLGSIRSTINIYYSDLEGLYPLAGFNNGFPSDDGYSLTTTISPKYIEHVPVPKLQEGVGSFNGIVGIYDQMAETSMAASPPKDVVVYRGDVGVFPVIERPWAYDPRNGFLYLCNDNYDTTGQQFYRW